MKKTVALILVLTLAVLGLSSCGIMAVPINFALNLVLGTSLASTTSTTPDYEGEPERFSYAGLEITLTDAFSLNGEYDNGAVFIGENGTTVYLLHFPYNSTPYEEGKSAEEYAEAMREEYKNSTGEANALYTVEIGEVTREGELVYFSHKTKIIVDVADALFFVYVTPSAVFAVEMIVSSAQFENYRPHIFEWARTVKYNNPGASA